MEFKHLKIKKEEKIVTVEISRPEALNALNRDLLLEIESCIAHLEKDNNSLLKAVCDTVGSSY